MGFENIFLRSFAWGYKKLVLIGSNLQSIFLLYMRLVWGGQFLKIGIHKWTHMNETIEFFTSLHLPSPEFHSHLVAGFEIVGGALLVLGFASRLIALPCMVILFSALQLVHTAEFTTYNLLFDPTRVSFLPPCPFLFLFWMVFLWGPGKVSIDAYLKRRIEKWHKRH